MHLGLGLHALMSRLAPALSSPSSICLMMLSYCWGRACRTLARKCSSTMSVYLQRRHRGSGCGRALVEGGQQGRTLWRSPARGTIAAPRGDRPRWRCSAARAPQSAARRGDGSQASMQPRHCRGKPHLGQPDAVVGAEQVLDAVEVHPEQGVSAAGCSPAARRHRDSAPVQAGRRYVMRISCLGFKLALLNGLAASGHHPGLTHGSVPASWGADGGAPATAPTS